MSVPVFWKTMKRIRSFRCIAVSLLLLFPVLSGCVSSMTGRLADNLSNAILDNNDPQTVADGGPAFLLLIDGLLRDDPENESLLRSAATLYTAYSSIYVTDKARAERLTDKGLGYALDAVCAGRSKACGLKEMKFDAFQTLVGEMTETDLPSLYTLGVAWAGWIEAHRDDWNAVADIARVEAIMRRVLQVDETFRDGGAHLYLGILATLIPPAMGGEPEKARVHFERAMEISGGENLMVKVAYARRYARLVFDRELHDRLLKEVLAADPDVEGYALMNALARREAEALLESGEDYF